ncbi:anti-sigma factor [Nocardioides gansuensis]|uniref:Anti-sigma factor n=1 Tax=Nocardioides gansuensis TaxID=2138300 RepID=A0A2T8FC78_9ACTN|nr:anti-sigma factor [Nocardioides gansuensis]PVG83305.1 anti-sigma factor [Nocardioides gansuensis]
MATSDDPTEARADVELRLPADGAFASVLRTTTAGLAARLDFTIDDIEDLRIAIAEASALVLAEADPGADLVSRFFLSPGRMQVQIETQAIDDPAPDYDSFAWQVLDTLATDAEASSAGGVFRVRFSMSSQVAPTEAGAGL